MNIDTLDTIFTDTADAIRAKLGTQAGIKPENFADNIDNISGANTGAYKRSTLNELYQIATARDKDLGNIVVNNNKPLDNNFSSGTIRLNQEVVLPEQLTQNSYIEILGNGGTISARYEDSMILIDYYDAFISSARYTTNDGVTFNLEYSDFESATINDAQIDVTDELFFEFFYVIGNVLDAIYINNLSNAYRFPSYKNKSIDFMMNADNLPNFTIYYNLTYSVDNIIDTSNSDFISFYDKRGGHTGADDIRVFIENNILKVKNITNNATYMSNTVSRWTTLSGTKELVNLGSDGDFIIVFKDFFGIQDGVTAFNVYSGETGDIVLYTIANTYDTYEDYKVSRPYWVQIHEGTPF